MFDIKECQFNYTRIGNTQFRATIISPLKQSFSIDFQNHPNFQANEDTNKQIFAEFMKNGKNFILEIESVIIQEKPPEVIVSEEIKSIPPEQVITPELLV